MKLKNSQYECDVCGNRCDCRTEGIPDIYLSSEWTNLEYHFCSYPCFHEFISNQEGDIAYTVYNSFLKDYVEWAMKIVFLALTEGEIDIEGEVI